MLLHFQKMLLSMGSNLYGCSGFDLYDFEHEKTKEERIRSVSSTRFERASFTRSRLTPLLETILRSEEANDRITFLSTL